MKYVGLALVLVCACAHVAPPSSLGDLTGKMKAARSSVQAYSADARITYFGKEGRARAGATLVVSRPSSMRYELHGPHGGVLQACATNGQELQLLDLQASQFLYGPATPKVIDALMQFAPLRQTAEQWVSMLFAEVTIPDEADIGAEKSQWVARWADHGDTREVLVDPTTGRVSRMRVVRASSVLSDVSVGDYDVSGVPTTLHIVVPDKNVDLEVKLSDLTINPELDPSVFTLDPPAALTPTRIDSESL